MDPLQSNTGVLPPALRAIALGLLVETVVPLLNKSRPTAGGDTAPTAAGGTAEESSGPASPGEKDTEGKAELWQALRCKCRELSVLVFGADEPSEAAEYALGYLTRHFEYVLELICGQKRLLLLRPPPVESRPRP